MALRKTMIFQRTLVKFGKMNNNIVQLLFQNVTHAVLVFLLAWRRGQALSRVSVKLFFNLKLIPLKNKNQGFLSTS
jgi:hypothetical protein